jgi:hypothetical protein
VRLGETHPLERGIDGFRRGLNPSCGQDFHHEVTKVTKLSIKETSFLRDLRAFVVKIILGFMEPV